MDMVRSHCTKHHRGRVPISKLEQAETISAQSNGGFMSSTSNKYIQPAGQKPVDGLQVLPGYMCPLGNLDGSTCSRAFVGLSTFTRHLSTHPKQNPTLNHASCASQVQTLFAQGGLQSYFAVDTSFCQPDPPPTLAYADALKLWKTLPGPQIPAPETDKERESVHWFTQWPELLKPYCNNDAQAGALRSLVSFPEAGKDPDWLVRVQDHGSRWWIKVESAHKRCTPRASGLLKSQKEYVSGLLPRSGPADLLL